MTKPSFANIETAQGTRDFHLKMSILYDQRQNIYTQNKKENVSLDKLAKKHNVSIQVIRTLIQKTYDELYLDSFKS